jgi:hypothetical protein
MDVFLDASDYAGTALFVRADLGASTDDQDATRAQEALHAVVAEHGAGIAATCVQNAFDAAGPAQTASPVDRY